MIVLAFLITLVSIAGVNTARALDMMGVHPDPGALGCALTSFAPFPGSTAAYIIHGPNAAGSIASQFRIIDNSGLFLLSVTSNYPLQGDNDDLLVSYGGCIAGDHVVVVLNFIFYGSETFTCDSVIRTDAAPSSPIPGEIAVSSCDNQTVTTAMRRTMWVGPEAYNCVTNECGVHPVASSTWGAVKALYK